MNKNIKKHILLSVFCVSPLIGAISCSNTKTENTNISKSVVDQKESENKDSKNNTLNEVPDNTEKVTDGNTKNNQEASEENNLENPNENNESEVSNEEGSEVGSNNNEEVDTKQNIINKSNVEIELKNNNELLVAQEKFQEIKNRIKYFESVKFNVPHYFAFVKNMGPNGQMNFENENQTTKLDDLISYVNELNSITKENLNSETFIKLKDEFDILDDQINQIDERNNKPTVVFNSKPNSEEIKKEIIKEFEKLQKDDFFRVVYDTKNNSISIDEMYKIYTDLIYNEYYKFPYLSVGSAATVNFKEKDGNVFVFSGSSNKLSTDAKKAMVEYVKGGLNLVNEKMSVYEKVFALTSYVDDKLNYMNRSTGLDDAYLKHWGVCKEYVEQAAILYSMAGLEFRIITGEQHIWFTFKNEQNKWFITDPTHLDPGNVDVDYPAVFQGSAKLISKLTEMFKFDRHLVWDEKINGVDPKLLDEVNNNITQQESYSLFNKFIDTKNESNYHFYDGKVFLVSKGSLSWFDSKGTKKINKLTIDGFDNNELLNLQASYKNHIYIIKNSGNNQEIYDYNIDNNLIKKVEDLTNKIDDFEYLFKDNKLILQTRMSSNKISELDIINDSKNNDTYYDLQLKLKLYYLKFGLFFVKGSNSEYDEILNKLNELERKIKNKDEISQIKTDLNSMIEKIDYAIK
ncbi:transglutaminase domain-containing protein [Mycoplasma sp. OR1901]|uniref:transglutaminase domain-containing protein n=1 Tax=Mycoplasma sp. OR1901 TaxID=2742195 RepID=UPI0015819F47|nr:transglutaminase domain-containing protein [Mycoplasma sp. OR1901]QKT05369.1 transglutaminase domain-containing protein [Mycoplasma sp. OR1901]